MSVYLTHLIENVISRKKYSLKVGNVLYFKYPELNWPKFPILYNYSVANLLHKIHKVCNLRNE